MPKIAPQNPSPEDPAHSRKVLLLAFGSTISMVIGVSSIMPLIPMLAKLFEVSLPRASLIITLYTLPGILFALLAGVLADRYGRKVVLASSLFLFCFSGIGCALAPNFSILLLFRFLQGIGASSLGVLNTTIIADIWSGRSLAKMIGYNMTVLSVCTALFPSIGGLAASLDWRFAFFLSILTLPVAILALTVPLTRPVRSGTFRNQLSNLAKIFHDKHVVTLIGMTFLTFIMLYGPLITCLPMLADLRFGASPGLIGIIMAVSSLGTALIAVQLGTLSGKYSTRKLLLTSQVLYIVSLSLIPNLPTLYWIAVPVFLYGIGQGLNVPNVQAQLLQAVPSGQRASIMAVNGMTLRLGQTLAPITFSTVMVTYGPQWGFYGGIVLACLLILISLFLLKDKPPPASQQ